MGGSLNTTNVIGNYVFPSITTDKVFITSKEVTSDYTIGDSESGIDVDASGGAVTVTLPSTIEGDRIIVITKQDSSNNLVTIGRNGNNIANKSSDQSLNSQNSYMMLKGSADETNWVVIATSAYI